MSQLDVSLLLSGQKSSSADDEKLMGDVKGVMLILRNKMDHQQQLFRLVGGVYCSDRIVAGMAKLMVLAESGRVRHHIIRP